MQIYEISYLILPSIPEDKLSDVIDKIRKVIFKEGGEEIDAEEPFKEGLAYSMSKTVSASHYVVSEAYISWLKFEIESSNIQAVKAGVEKIDEILRFLLVKAPRETTFTFAKAREKTQKKESEVPSLTGEMVVN